MSVKAFILYHPPEMVEFPISFEAEVKGVPRTDLVYVYCAVTPGLLGGRKLQVSHREADGRTQRPSLAARARALW